MKVRHEMSAADAEAMALLRIFRALPPRDQEVMLIVMRLMLDRDEDREVIAAVPAEIVADARRWFAGDYTLKGDSP